MLYTQVSAEFKGELPAETVAGGFPACTVLVTVWEGKTLNTTTE